jgi:anti-sigma B factor antagonist
MRDGILSIEDVTGSEGSRVLRLNGPVVLSTFFDLQTQLRGDQSPTLILDCLDVPYIDSAGIGALVCAYVSRQKHGRALVLSRVNDRVRNALKITRVDQFFTFSDTAPAERAATA